MSTLIGPDVAVRMTQLACSYMSLSNLHPANEIWGHERQRIGIGLIALQVIAHVATIVAPPGGQIGLQLAVTVIRTGPVFYKCVKGEPLTREDWAGVAGDLVFGVAYVSQYSSLLSGYVAVENSSVLLASYVFSSVLMVLPVVKKYTASETYAAKQLTSLKAVLEQVVQNRKTAADNISKCIDQLKIMKYFSEQNPGDSNTNKTGAAIPGISPPERQRSLDPFSPASTLSSNNNDKGLDEDFPKLRLSPSVVQDKKVAPPLTRQKAQIPDWESQRNNKEFLRLNANSILLLLNCLSQNFEILIAEHESLAKHYIRLGELGKTNTRLLSVLKSVSKRLQAWSAEKEMDQGGDLTSAYLLGQLTLVNTIKTDAPDSLSGIWGKLDELMSNFSPPQFKKDRPKKLFRALAVAIDLINTEPHSFSSGPLTNELISNMESTLDARRKVVSNSKNLDHFQSLLEQAEAKFELQNQLMTQNQFQRQILAKVQEVPERTCKQDKANLLVVKNILLQVVENQKQRDANLQKIVGEIDETLNSILAVVPDPLAVVPDPEAVVPDPEAVVPDPLAVVPDPEDYSYFFKQYRFLLTDLQASLNLFEYAISASLFNKIIERFKEVLVMIQESKIIEKKERWNFGISPRSSSVTSPEHPDDDDAKTSPSSSVTTKPSLSKASGVNSLGTLTTNGKELVTDLKKKLEQNLKLVWPFRGKESNAEEVKKEAITLTNTISTDWQEIKTQCGLSKAPDSVLDEEISKMLGNLTLWAKGIDEKDVVSLDSDQRIIDAKLAQSISSLEHDLSVLTESMRLFAFLNRAVASCWSLQLALNKTVVFDLPNIFD